MIQPKHWPVWIALVGGIAYYQVHVQRKRRRKYFEEVVEEALEGSIPPQQKDEPDVHFAERFTEFYANKSFLQSFADGKVGNLDINEGKRLLLAGLMDTLGNTPVANYPIYQSTTGQQGHSSEKQLYEGLMTRIMDLIKPSVDTWVTERALHGQTGVVLDGQYPTHVPIIPPTTN